MTTIKPFKAFRPTEDTAHRVAALPYDVMSRGEAAKMIQGNELSFLRVDRPEAELDSSFSFNSPLAYKRAAENLKGLVAKGALKQDFEENLYVYRLETKECSQTGLVACLSVDEYLEGSIKKHEHTRQDKELDRVNHILECNAQTGPIFLFYREQRKIQRVIEDWIGAKQPVYSFRTEDDITHSVWVIDDREIIKELTGLFKGVDNLYIADGHHRCAAAAKVCLKKREGGFRGHEEFNFFLGVIFPHNQLNILDYNRVIQDLNGLSEEAFLKKLSDTSVGAGPLFEISPVAYNKAYRPQRRHYMGMYLRGRWHQLRAILGTWNQRDPVECLDVSILQNNLLNPVLGIKDPRTDERLEFVGGIRGLKELERKVDQGAVVAFSLYPTSIQQLMSVADADRVMPPKSTWFEPKLRSGLFVHSLD